MSSARTAALCVLVGCTAAVPRVIDRGPVARSIETAADAAGVPADLVLAIAIEEGGLRLPAIRTVDPDDDIRFAGRLELRHGRIDTLAMGARLAGTTEAALEVDTEAATRAGALVLAALGAEHGAGVELASWRRALEVMSGLDDASAHDYASRVLARLRTGGTFSALGGERLELPAHPEVAVADLARTVVPTATPDYPGAIWFTTDCTNKCAPGRALGLASVDKIVIHDTEGDWDVSVATLQNDPGKSVHYIVDADGSRVGQFLAETDTAWHSGNTFYNETSIGIEHVGAADDPAGYSDALYDTSRALVTSIRTRWQVPLDRQHIVGHYQVPNGSVIDEMSPACPDPINTCEDVNNHSYGGINEHKDPGLYWMWCQYIEHLGGTCTCNDAHPHFNCTTDKTEAVRCQGGMVQIEHCTDPCEVQPVGVDDICHVDMSMPDAGVTDAGSDNPHEPGGCCQAGGGPGAAWLVVLAVLRRRRRARAA